MTTMCAVATVDALLRRARAMGASDLHLDPTADAILVRARKDGVLVRLEPLGRDLATRLVGRVKSLADLLVYRTDLPQEGRITRERSGLDVDVRVSTYPTLHGERVALRLDVQETSGGEVGSLGLSEPVERALEAAFDAPEGVVLLTGPSGSGKTTTLYTCLTRLAKADAPRSIVTIEDPIERHLPGVTQTQVNTTIGLTFARALRSILRQDPEVILVGEVRDRETAAIALEAGLTGHLVATTLHAGTAALVFARLLDMGVEPFVLTTAVRGALAQRLLRRTCSTCRGDATTCSDCHATGYRGRVLVAEWLPMGDPLRRAILQKGDGHALAKAAREAGSRTLREHASDLCARGLTTAAEVERVLGVESNEPDAMEKSDAA